MLNDNGNMLFDLNKIKCEIIIINEMILNYNIFDKIKKIIINEYSTIIDTNNNLKYNFFYIIQSQDEFKYFTDKLKIKKLNSENIKKNQIFLNDLINISITIAIINDNTDKSKYIFQYNSDFSKDETKKLKSYSRLIIINTKYYLDYLDRLEKNISIPKYENGIIYCDFNENNFKQIFQFNMIEIINLMKLNINNKQPLFKKNSLTIKQTAEIINRIEEYIQIQNFNISIHSLELLLDKMKYNFEKIKLKECLAILKFLNDYYLSNSLIYNSEINKLFLECIKDYNKIKQFEYENDCILRLCSYYLYFEEKFPKFIKLIKKIHENSKLLSNNKDALIYHLKTSDLYKKKNLFRNEKISLYYGILDCEYDKGMKNMVIHLINNIIKSYLIFDIYQFQINSIEDFDKNHLNIFKYKKIKLYICKNNMDKTQMIEYKKKKIEKDNKIYIINQEDKLRNFLLNNNWNIIQKKIYVTIINYMIEIDEINLFLSFYISYLQTLNDYLNSSIQEEIYTEIIKDSMYLQTKLKLSLIKMPILIKIIPISSKIKFDIENNPNVVKKDSEIFIFNPWEKNNTINYFWTKNSYQYINIQFKNILKIELTLSKIMLIFKTNETNKPISYPSNIIISPESSIELILKIKLINEGKIDIIGLSYDIGNITTNQFVDFNGKGFFSTYDNYINDPLYNNKSKKKELISLRNIQIYKEIPLIDISFDDNLIVDYLDDSINLFEYQEYEFNFSLKSNDNYPIDEIKCYIFVYKKNNTKICVKEINLKSNNDEPLINFGEIYKLKYLYLHLKTNYKIEFRIYYISKVNEKETINDEIILKPYIFYHKNINTKPILDFKTINLFPKIESDNIKYLTKLDSRIKKDYRLIYGTEFKYCSFNIINHNQNKIEFKIVNNNKNKNILNEIIDCNYSIEIPLLIDNSIELSDLIIYWNFLTNKKINGKFILIDAYQNYDNLLTREKVLEMRISINKIVNSDIEYNEITYSCINNTDYEKNNLKLYVYIYEINEYKFITSDFIPDNELFYEGTLVSKIKKLKVNETFSNTIKLYNILKKEIRTTFSIIDNENKIIFLSPNDKLCK